MTTKDQHKTDQTHIETQPMSKNEDGLKKVMNDEELEEYLDGQPDSVCCHVMFLNEINKGKAKLYVLEDNSIIIETKNYTVTIEDTEDFWEQHFAQ